MNNTNDTSTVSNNNSGLEKSGWQLTALTEALGDLRLTVKDSLSVGRGSDNDVVLGSKQVSRNHALLSVLNGELYVKDLESSNGTFVNDSRIESNKTKLLNHDDTVAFASFAFKVAKNTIALTESENKQSLAEEASVSATPDTSVVAPAYSANIETDSTDIGAIDTGIIKNEVTPTEVGDSEATNSEVTNSEIVDSEVIDSSMISDAINDNDVIDAEIIEAEIVDVEPINVENAVDETINTSLAKEATPVVDVIDIEDDKVEVIDTDNSAMTDATDPTISSPTISSPTDATVVEETIVDQPVFEEGVASDDTYQATVEPIDSEQNTVTETGKEPVVKQTIINDVLLATENDAHHPDTTPVEGVVLDQDRVDSPSLTAEPVIQQPEDTLELTLQPKSVVTPEHDKTTTTALQEEADPDVLRAKQAATSQFSGTANLGQSRDIGTEGNNALDQAINNPATHHNSHKKPSGSWFIWVFIAIIIIGLALWLFNKGAV